MSSRAQALGPANADAGAMSPRTAVLAVLALVAATSAGCALSSHDDEAFHLGDDLAALPGVAAAEVDYVEPELFDSADVNLRVRMRDSATTEQVVAVFATAYEALTDVHAGEEGNLVVRRGDDRLELRTFESEADVSDVEAASEVAAVVAGQQGRTLIEVMTQEVEEAPHVETSVWVWLAKGSDQAKVDRVRTEVEEAYGDLPVTVDARVRVR